VCDDSMDGSIRTDNITSGMGDISCEVGIDIQAAESGCCIEDGGVCDNPVCDNSVGGNGGSMETETFSSEHVCISNSEGETYGSDKCEEVGESESGWDSLKAITRIGRMPVKELMKKNWYFSDDI